MRKDARKRYSSTAIFRFAEGEDVVFRGLMPREVVRKTAYVEHQLEVNDRLDSLAQSYYGDPRLWWVIAQANPEVFFPADLVYGTVHDTEGLVEALAGKVILVPARPEGPA